MELEISFRRLIEILVKGKLLILAITATTIILTASYTFFVAIPIYETSIMLTVSEKISMPNYIQLIKIPEIVQKTIEQLDLKNVSYEDLNSRIRAESVKDTNLFKIYVKDPDPVQASNIANSLVKNFIEYIHGYSLEQIIANYEYDIETLETEVRVKSNTLSKLEQQLTNTPMFVEVEKLYVQQENLDPDMIRYTEQVLNPEYATIIENVINLQVEVMNLQSQITELQYQIDHQSIAMKEPVFVSSFAIPPSSPITPKKTFNLVIATLLGLVIGIGIVLFRHYWNSSKLQ